MITLKISLSEEEYNKPGLRSDQISFSGFKKILAQALAKERLDRSVSIAERHGLSGMTMDDIHKEVKATRRDRTNVK